MLRIFFAFLFCAVTSPAFMQVKNISVSTEADIVGGKEALEQVLETQLTLPKVLLTRNFNTDVTIYFEVDEQSRAEKITFNGTMNNVLRNELLRIMKFLRFNRKTAATETPYEYFLSINLSTENYARYMKQRTKQFIKSDKGIDSSFVVYAKADKSPEYFKNGEEGMTEFVMQQIEYPAIAKEKSIEGTVIIEFIVEVNGFVTNLNVKQGVSGGCTEEALKIIRKTKWQPAVLNGKLVRYKMSYPITFTLRSLIKDNSSSGQLMGQY